MLRKLLLSACVLLISPLLVSACAPAVGDACETSLECPAAAVCDTTAPEGYCLVIGCELNTDCPEESVCVEFDRHESFCMQQCSSDADCRAGYSCRPCVDGILCGGQSSGGFCYIGLPEGETPYKRAE